MMTHIRQHDTLRTKLHGRVLAHTPDVVSYDGIQYATVHQRWTRAKIRADYGDKYDATEFGCVVLTVFALLTVDPNVLSRNI